MSDVDLRSLQVCNHLGANVIATVSTTAKADLAKQNGAHHVLLSSDSSETNVKKIKDLTDGKGVHVVYDGVGKDTFEENFEVVRSKATIVTFGNASVGCLTSSSLNPALCIRSHFSGVNEIPHCARSVFTQP